MDREKERYTKGNNGHISRVKSYGKSSTTVLKEHLQTEHKIMVENENAEKDNAGASGHFKQQKLNFQKKLVTFQPFTSQYELNRDICIWGSLDLEPFMFVEKQGMQYFFDKNFPNMTLPSRSTVARAALYDVYDAVADKIKEDFKTLKGASVCVMFDGWSDKYRRYPYLGLRMSYVNNEWMYKTVTLSVKILEKHTADNMAAHVRQEIVGFGLSLNDVQLFTTHDGAANMVKTSRLLRSEHYQHCVAHSLHLLVVNDGINKVPEIVDLITRCKSAVVKLDAKCYIVEHECTKIKDRQYMDLVLERISATNHLLQVDNDISLSMSGSDDDDSEHPDEVDQEGEDLRHTGKGVQGESKISFNLRFI